MDRPRIRGVDLDMFFVNKDSAPEINEQCEIEGICEKPSRVDLNEVPIGAILYVKGEHPSAKYKMKVVEMDGERKVKIWSRSDTRECLICPVTEIFSRRSWITLDDVEEGVMELGRGFEFPYFKFDQNNGNLLPPSGTWLDGYKKILLMKKPQED